MNLNDVFEYIEKAKENTITGQWMKQLENASAKFHISRLEALNINLEQSLQELFIKEHKIIDDTLREDFEETYCRTMFELQKGCGIGFDVAKPNNAYILKVLSKPWAADGYNFSERIWKNKALLINTAHKVISQNILTGSDPQKAINAIAKQLDTSKYNAGRLVMTEQAYFSSLAQGECYNNFGVKKFQILATLDDRTSDICQSMDGKVFEQREFQAGVTAPPFHVYCRSTTIPYFDDDFDLKCERAARAENGKTEYVDGDITYPQWKEKYLGKGVDNGGESGIIEVEDGGISYRQTPNGKTIATRTINGSHEILLPKGSKTIAVNPTFDKYEVFAGKGSDKELRVKNHLVDNYGGDAENWFHAKGYTELSDENGEIRKANVHWLEEDTAGIYEIKVKGWSKK